MGPNSCSILTTTPEPSPTYPEYYPDLSDATKFITRGTFSHLISLSCCLHLVELLSNINIIKQQNKQDQHFSNTATTV